ncbi:MULTISPECIES: carbohydrate-binding protein [Paenibacillus]
MGYSRGTFVTYNGHTYKCLQSHKSISTWTPTVTPALWELQK